MISRGLYSKEMDHDSCGVGFVAHMKGKASHQVITDALTILKNLEHRGACGCEANTGDGAGILIQIPHVFLSKECKKTGIRLPKLGQYGVGLLFLTPIEDSQKKITDILKKIVISQGQIYLGSRKIPTEASSLGPSARDVMPEIHQVFIGLGDKGPGLPIQDEDTFERRLFLIRKCFEREITAIPGHQDTYFPSLSSRVLVYKGMLISYQLDLFYPELKDPTMESALALVHSRFSTNTFPNWELAQPFRFICHNGEINTLRGNINWMRAREALFESPLFGDEIKKVLPVTRENSSDSGVFDNALEMLVMGGYSLPHAVMMMIPEAWSGHEAMSAEKKAFYEYHSSLMEPWDGPASIAFTDGRIIGAVLDRNGLRPSRYYVTKDDRVIMASEVGVLDIDPSQIVCKGRLQPGKMFLVSLKEGRIIDDTELKETLAKKHPYQEWLKANLVDLKELPMPSEIPIEDHSTIRHRQIVFGYTQEDLNILMAPMAKDGKEAIGSMGNDAQLAVLSERPQLLFPYFKQLFAQVTNPPLDAIREALVTSTDTTIGSEKNLLNPGPENCHQIRISNPILDNEQMAQLKECSKKPYLGFRSTILPLLFSPDGQAMEAALELLFQKAKQAILEGTNILILSDRGVDEQHAAIPSLLATSGLHHFLVREGLRTRVGLVLESGEPKEVHHFCLLVAYGAGAINPYAAFETLDSMIRELLLEDLDHAHVVKNYRKAIQQGIIKVMSKMGISTIQSYRGAQIFEAIGINQEVIDKYFTHTATRIEGIGMDEITYETLARHKKAYPKRIGSTPLLDWGGEYQWRRDGAYHLLNPDTVGKLQHATKTGNYGVYKEYAECVNNQARHLCTLRGLFEFKNGNSIPLSEVEPISKIVTRFKTGAMSYGSISQEAHETLAIAMNRIGGKSNTGEGGEDSSRYVLDANGDSRNSAVKQVASGRFGVTSEYLSQAKELQIKIAQGAKPGEGGQLPGNKVWPWIAKVRLSTPGVGLISPPPHHDIYSIEDLSQLIFDLKNSNPEARISVKLVAEVGVGTVAAGVAKAHSDVVVIAGHDGGTGASPLTSIKHAGIPWELGLAETQQTLVINKLRDRITIETDGQLKTGRDVAVAALLGAEEYAFSTAPLVTLGCIMMRVCHLDTCPVGIATQNPKLRQKFTGKPEYVINFFEFVAQELREIMAELGFRTVDEMIGRSDLLETHQAIQHWKARGLDFSKIFYKPDMGPEIAIRKMTDQDHGIDSVLDRSLIEKCASALQYQKPVSLEMPICNRNRTTGTLLGHEITKKYGREGLPEDTIKIRFTGSAGQSFGAFIPKGLTLELEGDANDYVGKGLSGGRLMIYPPREASFIAEKNILIGNVVLYGATGGDAYFRGVAGERFCVRNSGAHAVVEGIGDHGCEYMTGGRTIILGPTGRNFGAGMSGGIAYIYDPNNAFPINCNKEMVVLDPLEREDESYLKTMLKNHLQFTGSLCAKKILDEDEMSTFVKVMPIDFKKALVGIREKMKVHGMSELEAMYG